MKSRNVIDKVVIVSAILLSLAFNQAGEGNFHLKKLFRTWHYAGIRGPGKNVTGFQITDTMQLSENGQFRYDIEKLNKHEMGLFRIIAVPKDSSPYKKALEFHYTRQNSKRIFNIMKAGDSLIIREGQVEFHYSSQRK